MIQVHCEYVLQTCTYILHTSNFAAVEKSKCKCPKVLNTIICVSSLPVFWTTKAIFIGHLRWKKLTDSVCTVLHTVNSPGDQHWIHTFKLLHRGRSRGSKSLWNPPFWKSSQYYLTSCWLRWYPFLSAKISLSVKKNILQKH